jgi:hypothetical protein
MRGMNHHPVIALLSLVVLIAGCSISVASSAPGPSAPPSPEAVPSAIPTAATALPMTPTPQPPASPLPSPTANGVKVDTVAVTVVDGLRVRSLPRVSDDSHKYEPLLPIGTPLYVLGGPISASGYTWYEVAPLSSGGPRSGWVASAAREGEGWLAAGDFDCPPQPTDLRSLASAPGGVWLACFPRVPITVEARIVECNCDVDGGGYSPSWFSGTGGRPELLIEPDLDRPPDDIGEWFVLKLDPKGQHPEEVPIGRKEGGTSWSKPGIVEVTGIFDHPAAAGCTLTEPDGEPVPSNDCRLAFAVTRLVSVGP